MIRLKYPLNFVKAGYKALQDAGMDKETVKSIQASRKRKVEKKISAYLISESQILRFTEEIELIRSDMSSPGSPVLTDMPKAPFNPMASQEKLAGKIDKITRLENRVNAIKSEATRMEDAIKYLDAIQIHIIRYTYGLNQCQVLPTSEISVKVGYSERQVYRMKDAAIEILAFLLLGPVEDETEAR